MVPLVKTAAAFSGSQLNPLVLMSDPIRTPDLLALAAHMPPRSALIYRHFGAPGLETRLRRVTASRGVQFLIGNDPQLAAACGADGVHFTRSTPGTTLQQWRWIKPDWIISAAGTKVELDTRPVETLDALFLSPVFASNSPSAGTAIGVDALRVLTRLYACPIFALGGINSDNAATLIGSGIAGIAAIDGFATALRTQNMNAPIHAKPDGFVTVTKQEDDDLITFTADVMGETATGELTLRRVSDDVWNADHTGVPKAIGGRGVGKALVRAMVEDARLHGYRVIPGCPFVAKLFERKPDWAKGVAA
ncbi:hypothetical protein GCM10009069_07240 [Algimonas arctica]|uniref:N-acetyltransferase domain-containing protein n=2 Tax=Algimonas arctica TaxID=1479486 RepID=A0A8J3CMI9_9PROT|nr:hypothetical protein GCM10009069_07240 [Algimonas arctica]